MTVNSSSSKPLVSSTTFAGSTLRVRACAASPSVAMESRAARR